MAELAETADDPILAALRRLHLTRTNGEPRTLVLVAIAWVPMMVGALLRLAEGREQVPILFDLSVHTRILIALPLLIIGRHLLSVRLRGVREQLYNLNLAPHEDLDRIYARADRLRDSPVAAIAIVILALLAGIITVTNVVGPTGLFSGIEEGGGLSFARFWYAVVALPLVQLLWMRWMWHWGVWTYTVIRLSRLPLATNPAHPDHAAGIGFLSEPIGAFGFLVFAFAAFESSVWATQILAGHLTLQACIPGLVIIVTLAFVVACGPLFAFMPMLYRARHLGLRHYNQLALRYVRGFQRRWIAPGTIESEDLLGTPDLQSLNDLFGAFESTVSVRLVPFSARAVLVLWGAAIVPMIPLAFTAFPAEEVFNRVGQLVLGFVA